MLFEKLVIKRIRDTNQPVTISTGLMYGHKILKVNSYQFVEIDDNSVAVDGDEFNMRCNDWDTLERIYNAIK